MSHQLSKKELILIEARSFFSQYGYDLTSLDAIAKKCGITKPAIYYYFKDKFSLYRDVICPEFEAIADSIEEHTQVGTPIERLKSYIETFGTFLIHHHDFNAIFAREIANSAVNIPKECEEQLSRTLKQLIDILDAGEQDGIFRKEEPFFIQMMIVTTLTSYNTTKPLRERIAKFMDNKERQEPNFTHITQSLFEIVSKGLLC